MSDEFEAWIDDRLSTFGRSGNEVVSDCPWCGRPKMYINPAKAVFFCQRCRERGRAERLVAKVEGVSVEEAGSRLRGQPGGADDLLGALRSSGRSRSEVFNEEIRHPLPSEFVPCFDGEFWRVPGYVDERRISDDAIIRHGLGYCERGRYRDRLIVPVIQGTNRTFVARLMGHPSSFTWTNSSGSLVEPPRYLGPKGGGLANFVYWLDSTPKGSDLVVVEGVFDAIRLIDLGFSAVATFGKHISKVQRDSILRASPRSVTFLRDPDATVDAWTDAKGLSRMDENLITMVATCPPGFDPDTLGAERGKTGVEEVLKGSNNARDNVGALLSALNSSRKN